MKRIIFFSWSSGQRDIPLWKDHTAVIGKSTCGWNELVSLIAFDLGICHIPVKPNNRVLAYLEALQSAGEDSFFHKLLGTDPFVASRFLLQQRDELCWYISDFSVLKPAGPRLEAFAGIESGLDKTSIRGIPDIYHDVCSALEDGGLLKITIQLNEALELYPVYVRDMLNLLITSGVEVIKPGILEANAEAGSNLRVFQNQLINLYGDEQPAEVPFRENDLSLSLYNSRYYSETAGEVSALLREQEEKDWTLLRQSSETQVSEVLTKDRGTSFEVNVKAETLPLVQVLKSFTNLVWNPQDVEAVFEFLNLPVKPFPASLAKKLSRGLLEAPGVKSEKWLETLEKYWNNYPVESSAKEKQLAKEQARYDWWFESELCDPEKGIGISSLMSRLSWIQEWAVSNGSMQKDEISRSMFRLLGNLCLEISELASVISKDGLVSRLEMDKLLELVLNNKTQILQDYSAYSSGVIHSLTAPCKVDRLVWLDFSEKWEQQIVQDFLWKSELEMLEESGIMIAGKKEFAKLNRYATIRRILLVEKQLLLCWPSYHGSSYNYPHSLWLYLDSLKNSFLSGNLKLAEPGATVYEYIKPVFLERAGPIVKVNGLQELLPRDHESYSSISNMLYNPHSYLMGSILGLGDFLRSSLELDALMKGTIIHRFAEITLENHELMNSPISKERWKSWCDSQIPVFIEREAALLQQRVHSVERVFMEYQLRDILFRLVESIAGTDWEIEGVEAAFDREFDTDTRIYGRADLVLRKGERRFVVDLKSGSSSYKVAEIVQNADWQLLLYSFFGHEGSGRASAAYFTMDKGQFIGREDPGIRHFELKKAKEGEEVGYPLLLDKIKTAMIERIGQLSGGDIEFRFSQENIDALDDNFAGVEMHKNPNKFDDYGFLNAL